MKRGLTGHYITLSTLGGETCRAFLPSPLPPEPPLEMDMSIRDLMDRSLLALGRLDSIAALLPDTSLFLYAYVRKEAVLSSQIEGTQSSLSDLLLYESKAAPGVPLDDVRETSNYVAALEHGLKRLHDGLPLSLRLLREVHEILLQKGRGSGKNPGEFRHSQNWVGGSRPGNAKFIPPPPDRLMECLGALEKFFHDEPVQTQLLVKAALSHVQFETIHPFLDGNGRVGRLLITLLLCSHGALKNPTLYLSLYFKRRRQEYYDLLQKVRMEGDWEAWLHFFLDGVRETAESAVETAKKLVALFNNDRARIQTLGRKTGSAIRVHHALQGHPILSPAEAARRTGLTVPSAMSAFAALKELKICRELPDYKRPRLYCHSRYLSILNEGTES
ncbi:MAG: Fic family protein [Verrucomicrobiae bacterium]|nr:Fic family protein [Verrucomicrobiae bacterium]